MDKEKEVAMQTRCVYCKKEQYALVVYDVSHGKSTCAWCGKFSKEMSYKEYINELNKSE